MSGERQVLEITDPETETKVVGYAVFDLDDEEMVAEFECPEEARLLRAAPALVAAAVSARRLLALLGSDELVNDWRGDEIRVTIDTLDAAIATAKGVTQ